MNAAASDPHPAIAAARQKLAGWGNCPVELCDVTRPQTREALHDLITRGESGSYIPRGLGRSYGDSALNQNAGVIVQTAFNCFISFDPTTGILHAEAGVSLAEIIDVFLPLGFFPPTTPGTKFVTLGGAIAADVHGKNHHADGSFGNFIIDLQLMLASGEIITCSPTQKTQLFNATIGGMGLTGVILTVRLQLTRVPSAYYDVTFRRTRGLDETLESFTAHDAEYRYSVAWIDCLASGPALGRCVMMLGNSAEPSVLPEAVRRNPYVIPAKRKKSVPFNFPSFALNSLSIKAFNTVYYSANRDGQRIVDYDTFFYPLDGIMQWNRIYGKRGFVQYQALFPPQTARRGLRELLERAAASKKASFLAVLKRSGESSHGMLSYLYPGFTLAMDFANTGESLLKLLREFDQILLKHGGRLYMAKDAATDAGVFAAMYPRLAEFQSVKTQFDPNRRFASSQARRLGILAPG